MIRTSVFVAAICVLTPLASVNSIVLAQQTTSTSSGQAYPAKPIRMVAPFAAGGVVDALGRAVGDKLRPALGQPVIIDNRPGAGGNIGADLVAKAEPDGYTLLMSSAGILTINESLYPKMPFNATTAFAPVSLVAEMHMLMVVGQNSPAKWSRIVRDANIKLN